MRFSRIIGTGSHLPGVPITNDDLVARGIETSDEWIRTRTGIAARHFAAEGEMASDLALVAARRALEQADCRPDDIDLIVLATSTPDYVFPSTATLLQAKLGMTNRAPAFDVQAVCSGFIYALALADKFLRLGEAHRALVVGAEVFSRILDWNDRSTCVLFGDGAGAIVLEADELPGILATRLHADGRHHAELWVPGQVGAGKVQGDPFVRMEGQAVFKFAVQVLAEVAHEVLDLAKLPVEALDWLIRIRPTSASCRLRPSAWACRSSGSSAPWIGTATLRRLPFRWRSIPASPRARSVPARRCCSKGSAAGLPGARRCCAIEETENHALHVRVPRPRLAVRRYDGFL